MEWHYQQDFSEPQAVLLLQGLLRQTCVRLCDTRTAAAKVTLVVKQTEQKQKRSTELQVKHLEMEMEMNQNSLN